MRCYIPSSIYEFNLFTRQLLVALVCLHSLGIVHNDLKLPNCLFDKRTDEVTLIDFEHAQFYPPGTTWTADPIGTQHYQPPEMIHGEVLDHRGDVWRLGLMLAEIVSDR